MTTDLRPAARQMAALVRGTRDELLTAPTPCPDYSVGDLLDHIGGLATAFVLVATKEALAMPEQNASGDASRLEAGWRERIAGDVVALAEAWQDPAAWNGMTKAGPFELPGEIAVSTGQDFTADDTTLEGARAFLATFSGPGTEEQRGDGFGSELPVAADAPLLERVLAMAGRDVHWRPPR
jgi:uncharacterized protein (TIGR03083 family)